jgi:hypothetical protein
MSALIRTLVTTCVLLGLFAGPVKAEEAAARDGLGPGDVLSQENWQKAKGLLPPEVLEHYKKGDYRNEIVEWPLGIFKREQDFIAATEANRGKFTVNEYGTVVDKKTGEQPPYIYGYPFPDVDEKDPTAGIKILWNSYYGYWYLGNSHNEVRLIWVNPDGVDREAGQDVHFLYYDGQTERYRMPNPQNFLMQFISSATYPTDLYGTTALTWRYRDSLKRDSNWAYVPALRRVRAVSPANRSDGFLGSDMSQDDGPFFDGKPEDFEWKLLRATEQLRLVDPLSLKGQSINKWLPGGGWRGVWPDMKTIGFQEPSWKGIAWAPLTPALARRPMWVVEATPRDKYYLYGKVELYLDRETYQGAYNRKFSWKGELLNTYYVLGFLSDKRVRPDGGEEILWGHGLSSRREHQDEPRDGVRSARSRKGSGQRPARALRPELLRLHDAAALREMRRS